jgi:Protein of unknown function (DUF3237)
LPAAPQFLHVADLQAFVASAIDVSPSRRIIAITGGTIRGEHLNGTILSGGADSQIIRPDGVIELTARYVIRADSGVLIYVENSGLRHGPPDAMQRLRNGEPVDPGLIYFRTTPRFETSAPEYDWLTKHIFVGTAVRLPDSVNVSFYQLL